MNARIAKRNGAPAWVDAPPRMPASQIDKPFGVLPIERRGLLARVFGLRAL